MCLYRDQNCDVNIFCGQRVGQSGTYRSGIFEGVKRQQSQLGKKIIVKLNLDFFEEVCYIARKL